MAHTLLCLLVLIFGTARGFAAELPAAASPGWKASVENGVHWLKTPDGRPFYSKGVNIVVGGRDNEKSRSKEAFFWGNFYPSLDEWRHNVGAQLLDWGFNTRGGWSDPSPEIDIPLTVDLELGRNSKFHWFDPFDPAMERITLETAHRLTAPHRNDPRLLGYFSDNEVGWWNSPLFTWYLQKGWDNHTKRVLWGLLYDHYNGRWERFLVDWVPEGPLSNFEDLKAQGTKLKLRPGGEGIHLVDRFLRVYTTHYYRLMARAIREAHPGALILGDRLPLYYHQDAVLAIGDNVDVISTNYNVDVPDGWVAPYYFEGLRRLSRKPVLITEFFFAAQENRSGNRNETARCPYPKPGHLMTVATQAQRAWGALNAARNFARFPNVVGAHWFQYCDEPLGGREDGEDYNMGLIDTSNRPYEELTEAFKRFNQVAEAYHRESAAFASNGYVNPAAMKTGGARDKGEQGATELNRASRPMDVNDQCLMDWEMDSTRLQGFQTPEPYVPFGDIHLAWTPEGLYLAGIANTYVDPKFLAYEGEFPLGETFQIHVLVEAEGKFNHFAVYLQPHQDPLFPDGFQVLPKLYRLSGLQPPVALPTAGRVQRLNKSLPHMLLEAFLPAEWLGLEGLSPGMKLRMNIVMTSYYREHTMVWSGTPNLNSPKDLRALKTVVLKDLDVQSKPRAGLPGNHPAELSGRASVVQE